MWWFIAGLGLAVLVIVISLTWSTKRSSSGGARSVMTETADGEPLQFLVRATRKSR